MKIVALYVYEPTTITTDTSIEPMGLKQPPINPGKLVLQPGIYRFPATAQINVGTGKAEQVALGDDKTQWPDPPGRALIAFNMDAKQIKGLLGGGIAAVTPEI
jgi:hypothetical protein